MSIRITIDEAGPLLERLKTAAQAQGLALIGARAAGQLVRDHLFGINSQRHRYGRNYYAQAARSVNVQPVTDGAAININQVGMRLRYFGGVVRAGKGRSSATGKLTKYLTIPARSEAHGMRASEFADLDFQLVEYNGSIRPALVRRLSTPIRFSRRKQKDGSIKTSVRSGEVQGGEVMFWLVRQTKHQPDPSILPYPEQLNTRAVEAIKLRVIRVSDRDAQRAQEDN